MARGNTSSSAGSGTTKSFQLLNDNQNPDPSQNPSSPYYIHPSENPSNIMVSSLLVGPNYHSWARSMKRAMIAKNKFGFLSGTILMPDLHHPLYPLWKWYHNFIHSWLMHSVSPQIA